MNCKNFGITLLLELNVTLVICFYVTKSTAKLSKHPILIVVSYDGFRYDYLTKTKTPNLNRVKAHGVSVPYMQNQFSTITFPNHQSIATGLYIESHGIVSNELYDPLYKKVLNGRKYDPGFWNYSSSVLPLWVVNELAGDGRVSGVMMWPGSAAPYGKQNIQATYTTKYNNEYRFENRVDEILSWITNKDKPANLVFLYCEEPDSTAHDFGPEGPEIIKQIQRMDNVTGYLWQKLKELKISDKVNIIFLSDHGMQEVKPGFFLRHKRILDNENNKKYFQYGTSAVMQILPVKKEETMEIYTAFKEASKSMNFSVYLKSEMRKEKPQWHYSNSRRILPIVVVADPGYIFEGTKVKDHSIGSHGYDSDYPAMHPYFMATGPLFKSNSTIKPFNNIDIYSLICHIMGMEAPPNNGSLNNVLPLLLPSDFTEV